MKANELRIGNYVKINKYIFPVKIQDIEAIDDAMSLAEPIPLTEEWLLRFGFIREEEYDEGGLVDYRYELNKDNLEFVSFWGSEDLVGINQCQTGVDCEYVHQLQNLYFALTGEELTIKE